jgi:hypothetical protein
MPTYGSSSYWLVSDPFRVSFMRAARSLVDRGLLIAHDDEDAPNYGLSPSFRPRRRVRGEKASIAVRIVGDNLS